MPLLPPGPPGPAPIRFLSALVDHAVVLIGAAVGAGLAELAWQRENVARSAQPELDFKQKEVS